MGLPEVIYTSEGNLYLHLPGVIVAESDSGETRYLLSDGLGSVRQAVDENADLVAYNEFDPYGNPILHSSFLISNYGFTGEWWENEVGLLHLRARWYLPETGTFVSKDVWEGDNLRSLTLNGWSYVEGNPVNFTDPSGFISIGTIYNGEFEPLRDRILFERSSNNWRLEENLFGNDRFRHGVVRFGNLILRLDIPPIVSPSYFTRLHFQGYLNISEFVDGAAFSEFVFKLNYNNGHPNITSERPGTDAEYESLDIFPTGEATYWGGAHSIPPIRPGQNVRTNFMGEGQLSPAPGNTQWPRESIVTPPGLSSAAYHRTAATAVGRVGNMITTPPAGRRKYQFILQESLIPEMCRIPHGRWRVLIQTYQLWATPRNETPEVRRNYLTVSPTGVVKETPF
jgi:RHS repeat-associated protein